MKFIKSIFGVLLSLILLTSAFAQSADHKTETRIGNWINLTDVNAGQSHLRFGNGEAQEWFRLSCFRDIPYYLLMLRVQPYRNYTGVDQHEINVQILVDDNPYQVTSYHTEWPNHLGVSDGKFITAKFKIPYESNLLKRMYFSKQIQFGIPGFGAPYSLVTLGEQGAALNEFQNVSSRHQNACLQIQETKVNEPEVTANEPAQPEATKQFKWNSLLGSGTTRVFAQNSALNQTVAFECADHEEGNVRLYLTGDFHGISMGAYNVRIDGSGGSQFAEMQRRAHDIFAYISADDQIWRDFKSGYPIKLYFGDQLAMDIGNVDQGALSDFFNECLRIKAASNQSAQPQNVPSQEPTPAAEFEYIFKKHENNGHDAVMQVLDKQSRTQWMAFWCHPSSGSTIQFNVLDKKGIAPNGAMDLVIDVAGKQVSVTGNKRGELVYFSSDLYSELKRAFFTSDANASTSIYFNGQPLLELPVSGVAYSLLGLISSCLQDRHGELEQYQTYVKNLANGVDVSANTPASNNTQQVQQTQQTVNEPVNTGTQPDQVQPNRNPNIPTDPNALAQLCAIAFPKPGSDLAKACELVTGLIASQNGNAPQQQQQPLQPQQSFSNTVNYRCNNGAGFAVRYDDNGQTSTATLIMQGIQDIILPQVISGSGNKYNNGQIDWHTKGGNGLLSQNGQSLSCAQQ